MIAKTPVAARTACFGAPGCGKAGFRTTDPARRIDATSIKPLATIQHQPGAIHTGIELSAVRHETITHNRVSAATIE